MEHFILIAHVFNLNKRQNITTECGPILDFKELLTIQQIDGFTTKLATIALKDPIRFKQFCLLLL